MTNDNEKEAYSPSSSHAPHAAAADDVIMSYYLPLPLMTVWYFFLFIGQTNVTDDNKDKLYSLLSPTAPHAAAADDHISLIFLSATANDRFLLFFI